MQDPSADARILEGFDFDDLDEASLAAYRERFAATTREHPWLALDDKTFLLQLGCWRKERDIGRNGLTLAGLLMLGRYEAIVAPGAAPNYFVDFRDYRGQQTPKNLWSDRLFPDGTWEANLFQFFERCWPKLIADLKVPRLLEAERAKETPVHVALREAFVNALIHADYGVPGGIVIERHDARYLMENPGTLLVSEEQLRRGGVSQCRNRLLQRMFMLIGGGDRAGSGYRRIQDAWWDQTWSMPRLSSQGLPDRIRLDLVMRSVVPEAARAPVGKRRRRSGGLP
jgi:predicted HTH transcriptional regulator